MNNYVLIFVLSSLTKSQQAVQACHACFERASINSHLLDSSSIVFYQVEDLDYVKALLGHNEIDYSVFKEPDLGNIETAICTSIVSASTRKVFKNFPLCI